MQTATAIRLLAEMQTLGVTRNQEKRVTGNIHVPEDAARYPRTREAANPG
jgi:hypothetical protein